MRIIEIFFFSDLIILSSGIRNIIKEKLTLINIKIAAKLNKN